MPSPGIPPPPSFSPFQIPVEDLTPPDFNLSFRAAKEMNSQTPNLSFPLEMLGMYKPLRNVL